MKAMPIPITIGKAARQAGVGVETIRFYERRGLIQRPLKAIGAGIRNYPPETIARIRFIREAQELGFSLREIKDLLTLKSEPGADCSEIKKQAQVKLTEVERKIAQLGEIRAALQALIAACPGRGALKTCSILDHISHPTPGCHRPPHQTETFHENAEFRD